MLLAQTCKLGVMLLKVEFASNPALTLILWNEKAFSQIPKPSNSDKLSLQYQPEIQTMHTNDLTTRISLPN